MSKTKNIFLEDSNIASDLKHRKTINFTLPDNTVYAFGNEVNVRFRHGIPQLDCDINQSRVSIIVWGYSKYLN